MKCVCDRCGIKFDHYYVTGSNYALSFPEVRVLAQGDGESHSVVENIFDLYQDWGINLCPDCSEKFMDWMHTSRNDADILLQDAKNDLRVAEERIENLEADVNRLHSDIFELSKENDKLEDDNEQLGFLNSNLIKDNEALDKENHCIMKDSEWRANRIDELEKENHCLRNEINQLNSELNDGERIKNLKSENNKLKNDNELLGFINSRLGEDNKALEKENSYLKKEIHQLSWEEWMGDNKDPNKKKIQEAFDRFNDALCGDGDVNGNREIKNNAVDTPKVNPIVIDATDFNDIRLNCNCRGSNSNCQYPKRKGKTRNKRRN